MEHQSPHSSCGTSIGTRNNQILYPLSNKLWVSVTAAKGLQPVVMDPNSQQWYKMELH